SQPDLVLMDVAMPKLDGYAATQQIRAAETDGRRVPIIMLTAEADVGERVKGLRAGADDDIVKPFHPLELMARIKALLARGGSLPTAAGTEATTLGRLAVLYGAKGGVGTTTIAINTAIAMGREMRRRTALIDANLQFGDLRVFLDLGLDTASIVNAVSELLNLFRKMYDYTFVDMVKTIDDFNLQLFDEADVIFVIMTADLSCLKNVRSVLETMDHLGYEKGKVQLVLNRSNAYTGINVNNAESALARKVDYQIINEYRGAISALNSGEPFMSSRPDGPLGRSVADFARKVDEQLAAEVAVARA